MVQNQTWYGALKLHSQWNFQTKQLVPVHHLGLPLEVPLCNLSSTVASVILCHVPSHAKALLQGLCDNSKGVKIVVVTNWRSETGAKNVWILLDTV